MKKVSPINFTGYSGFFLVLVYLFYYLKKVDVSLTYSWQQTIPLSLGDSLKFPGGISALLADLILEFTTQAFIGSVMLALLLIVVFISLKTIFRGEKGNPFFFALLIAALIPFILMFSHYRLPFGLLTGVVVGLLLGMFQSYYFSRNLVVRTLFNFIAGLIVYMVSGVPGLLVLLQVTIIHVVYTKRYVALVSVLPLLTLPLLYLPFNLAVSIKQALLGPILVSEYNELPLVFYFSLSAPLLLFLGFSMLNFVFSKFNMKRSLLISAGSMIIVMAVLVYTTHVTFDESEKNGYAIIRASFDEEWEEVLKLTKGASSFNNLIQFEVNRALYGSGLLLDKLFSCPQQFGEKGIFLDGFISSGIAIHTAAFYYDLGFANETRHWATEAQMVLVRHPIVLKQLVMSYIAIGEEETALKYCRVLSGSRLYREWCDHVFMMLENNEAGDDPDIKFFRINNPAIDFFAGTSYPDQKLKQFFSSNKNNNMAFEYLIASYLLKHNVGSVVFMLPEFRKQGYEKLPIAVEEALMIYIARSGNTSLMSEYSISKSTLERFSDFSELIANVDNRAEQMERVSKYKNTYWYYLLFSSPYAKK